METLFIDQQWKMDKQTATLQITNCLRSRNFRTLCIFLNYQKHEPMISTAKLSQFFFFFPPLSIPFQNGSQKMDQIKIPDPSGQMHTVISVM